MLSLVKPIMQTLFLVVEGTLCACLGYLCLLQFALFAASAVDNLHFW